MPRPPIPKQRRSTLKKVYPWKNGCLEGTSLQTPWPGAAPSPLLTRRRGAATPHREPTHRDRNPPQATGGQKRRTAPIGRGLPEVDLSVRGARSFTRAQSPRLQKKKARHGDGAPGQACEPAGVFIEAKVKNALRLYDPPAQDAFCALHAPHVQLTRAQHAGERACHAQCTTNKRDANSVRVLHSTRTRQHSFRLSPGTPPAR